MRKFWWVVLNILTFGVLYLVVRNNAKKSALLKKQELSLSNDVDFDVQMLILSLGSKENIVSVTATMNTVKIVLKNASTLNKADFEKFDIKGFIKNDSQVILIFGDNSHSISSAMNRELQIS